MLQSTATTTATTTPPELTEYWYTYDAENRLKIHNGMLVNGRIQVASVYEDSYELLYDAAGRQVARYTWRPDGQGGRVDEVHRTVWDLRGQKTLRYHADTLGDDSDGGVATRYWYDAAGRLSETRSYYERGSTREVPADGGGSEPRPRLRIGGWLQGAEQSALDRDGRLVYQVTFRREDTPEHWRAVQDAIQAGTGKNQYNDLGVLAQYSRIDYSTDAGASGYDAAGRAWHYRYSGAAIGGATHRYTTTFQGWEDYRELSVAGTSTDPDYKATTNTLRYDGWGRLLSQREHSEGADDLLDDRIRHYAYTGDGAVQLRRGGTITDAGVFEQTPDTPGPNDNTLFVHAAGQQQAQLHEGGVVHMATGDRVQGTQLQGLGGSGGYAAGGGKVTVQPAETLRSLAQRVYGGSHLWYVLADANGLSDPDAELTAGTQLNAPSVDVNRNDAGTFKPYNPNEAIGSTSPSLPHIPPPPEQHCNAVAVVLMVVIAVVVAVATWGALTGMVGTAMGSLGTSTAMTYGAVAGAAGAAAGQVAGSVMGVTSFSWRNVAAGAVTGALTAGLGVALGSAETATRTAAMAVGNATANYVGQKVAGVDTSFSWASIVASAVGSAVGSAVAAQAGNAGWGTFAQDLTAGAVGGVVSLHARRALGMGDDINYYTVAVDAFGNALSNALTRQSWHQGDRQARSDSFRDRYPNATASLDNGDHPRSNAINAALANELLLEAQRDIRVRDFDLDGDGLITSNDVMRVTAPAPRLELEPIEYTIGENVADGVLLGLKSGMSDLRERSRSIVDNASSPGEAALGAGIYAVNSVTDAVMGGIVDTARLLTSSEQREQFVDGVVMLATTNPMVTAHNAWDTWSNLSNEDRLRYGAATLASLGTTAIRATKAVELGDVPEPNDIVANSGNAADLAREFQTKFPYVNQDPMRPIALKEGKVLAQVVFEPGAGPAGSYFTTPSAIRRATRPDGSIDANALNQGLQIDASRYPSFRPTVQYFSVGEGIPYGEAAFGRTIANTHLNPSGYPALPQVFIKEEFLSRMVPVDRFGNAGVVGYTMVNTKSPAYLFELLPLAR